jgi:SHS2 domain-containing protein
MKYKFLPHTADAKFEAFGKNLEEAFSHAALAMYSILVDSEMVKPAFEEAILVNGTDSKSLLYNFLEELLFLFETKGFLLRDIKTITITPGETYTLQATAQGDLHLDQYVITGEVKAVTYSEMDISETDGMFRVQVVLDL